MFKRPKMEEHLLLGSDEATATFSFAEVLFALEWSAVAPGMGGWDVLIDDERHTSLVSIVPPGAEVPCFFVYTKHHEVVLTWMPANRDTDLMEVGRFGSLTSALLALCPLSDDQMLAIEKSMEIFQPRTAGF